MNPYGFPTKLVVMYFITVISGAFIIFMLKRCRSRRREQKDFRRPYAFSLLKDGNSFFDDDEREVEIFKRPIKGKLKEKKQSLGNNFKKSVFFNPPRIQGSGD